MNGRFERTGRKSRGLSTTAAIAAARRDNRAIETMVQVRCATKRGGRSRLILQRRKRGQPRFRPARTASTMSMAARNAASITKRAGPGKGKLGQGKTWTGQDLNRARLGQGKPGRPSFQQKRAQRPSQGFFRVFFQRPGRPGDEAVGTHQRGAGGRQSIGVAKPGLRIPQGRAPDAIDIELEPLELLGHGPGGIAPGPAGRSFSEGGRARRSRSRLRRPRRRSTRWYPACARPARL